MINTIEKLSQICSIFERQKDEGSSHLHDEDVDFGMSFQEVMKRSQKTNIISVCLFLMLSFGVAAQCPQLITIETQFELDNFSNTFDACTDFDGHLIIKGSDIVNIDALANLASFTGTLEIIETNVKSIDALGAIPLINGSLLISENPSLENLAGLEHVIELDSLVLHSNFNMKDFVGLNNLSSVEYLSINNMNVSSFNGFDALSTADKLIINNNNLVNSLDGFSKLKNSNSIQLNSNAALTSLDGMHDLKPEYTWITISNNPSLINLNGFEQFERLHILELEFNTALESLDGLENIERLSRLNINNCKNLEDLSGLSNLEFIEFDFSMRLCEKIEDFSQLSSLERIGNNLLLSQLYSLVHLDDFNNVNIGNEIFIGQHANLIDVTGFNDLKEIQGALTFDSCPELISIAGFSDMKINGGLIISQTQKLKDLTGLANLQSVNGKLEIFENESLENLDDLISLTFVGGINDDNPQGQKDVQIENNAELTSIQGLNDLLYADDKIFIRNNPKLTICDIESICRFINDPNIEITIEDNGFPCNSPEQIRSDCNSIIADTNLGNCEMLASIEITEPNANTNGLMKLYDEHGNIVCAIDPKGNSLGLTNVSLYLSDTDRYDDFNRPFLRRNLSIESEFEPESPILVRIYFKDIELERLMSLDPNVIGIEDLRITPIDSICANTFVGNPSLSQVPISNGNYLNDINLYVDAEFTALANYFLHGPSELTIDADGDGFDSSVDCDDQDPIVNPDAQEIPDNDIDENCDGVFGITDLDGDGYGINEDCNDQDPNINPGAIEIINNDIDEDCDGVVNLSDTDGDGYDFDVDCDDNNPNINPGAIEIIDNDIDENCDGIIEITDLDNDGFGIAEDCDDLNAAINPGAVEIPDNLIDENCDGIIGITDLDEDGFGINEDCDDDDPLINPNADDIPNNGIDEDCDGEDLTPILNLENLEINIYPNPASDHFVIASNEKIKLNVQLINLQGRVILETVVDTHDHIELTNISQGSYVLKIANDVNVTSTLLFISH